MVEKNDVSLETQDSVDVKRNVPSLRFPKFKEKWKTLILDDVIKEFVNGQTPSRNHDEYWKGNIPWLSSGELNYGFINDSIEKITEKGQKSTNLRILPRNTFLIAIFGLEATGTRGSCGILNIPSTISQACMALIPYEEKLKMNFLYYWYNKVGDLYGVKYTQGTKQQNFNIELLKKLSITLPSNLEEQEKIANFLSLIDKKIELLEKTLVLYEKIEKHYIKKIYNNISDGEKISLKNIFNVDSSNLSINSLEENNGKYKLYGAEGVIKTIDFYEKMEPYISIIKDGAGVGRLNLCDAYSSSLGTLQNLVPKENLDINFLYFYLKTLNFQKYIVGSTIPHIYFRDYSKEKLSIPNIEKQKNIGNFFIYFEKRNMLLNNKIGCLTNFKKYLLQNMFI